MKTNDSIVGKETAKRKEENSEGQPANASLPLYRYPHQFPCGKKSENVQHAKANFTTERTCQNKLQNLPWMSLAYLLSYLSIVFCDKADVWLPRLTSRIRVNIAPHERNLNSCVWRSREHMFRHDRDSRGQDTIGSPMVS
jgi:hypothetical protein